MVLPYIFVLEPSYNSYPMTLHRKLKFKDNRVITMFVLPSNDTIGLPELDMPTDTI